ncbi:MAG TPA: tRNA (adenosine(37)-N6)-threonylcarbamoyltransferase complex ATPase subunit type 1 TsaE [Dehalococcoidales bacterium]|nr:tRNA (adenosine(37)-N6)-threonylcarbamoyltransferase complex ATPase subunit type 1 TsaE [Dehalococcoidales bacterium]
MKELLLETNSADETRSLGKWLGRLARPGDIFLLTGNLGAGKTTLTQGIVWGLDSEEYALSPTFVLMREIQGRLPLYHIDLYRLENKQEISDLCLDEQIFGQGLSVIEWGEKGLGVLPPEHLRVNIEYTGDSCRKFLLQAGSRHYQKLLQALNRQIKKG